MMLVVANRNLGMMEAFKHPLGPVPWVLAICDGSAKNKTIALSSHLEKRVSLADTIPTTSACATDGLALLHKINSDNRTFSDLSDKIFVLALHTGTGTSRIDVFDVYSDISIKNSERENNVRVLFSNTLPSQKIQQ